MPSQDTTQPAIYRVGAKIYRSIQLLVICILVLATIYGWHWLSDPAEFPIKSVKIEAKQEHVDQKTLQTTILPYVTQGFIALNTSALKEQLLTLPWVAEVRIERVWPDTVIIRVVEQQAVARWGKTGVLNNKGETFTPPENTIPTGLPILSGPADQTAVLWTNYQKISEILKPLELSVRALSMDERLSLQVELENGTRLLLGKRDPLLRLQRFAKVYHKIFTSKEAQAEYIDLRYENGVSIKWRSTTDNPSEKPSI